MPKIYICDDEPRICSDISEKVKELLCGFEISQFSDSAALIGKMSEQMCDILLLDIDMPELNGFDIAARLGLTQKKTLLVFVTSHDELVYDSLRFHPFGFVRKAFMDKELPKVLSDCVNELNSREKHFCFHSNNAGFKLLLSEILYFES